MSVVNSLQPTKVDPNGVAVRFPFFLTFFFRCIFLGFLLRIHCLVGFRWLGFQAYPHPASLSSPASRRRVKTKVVLSLSGALDLMRLHALIKA